jgi:hypothetical protein
MAEVEDTGLVTIRELLAFRRSRRLMHLQSS